MNKDLESAFLNKDLSKLLKEVLDKLDKQSQRKNSISFLISSTKIPSLYTHESYDTKYDLNILLKEKIFELSENKKDEFLSLEEKRNTKLIFNFSKESILREFYNRKKEKTQKESWLEDLEKYFQKDSELYNILEGSAFYINGKTNSQILERLKVWCESSNKTVLKRHEAAKCFWGISKAFDEKYEFCSYFKLQEKPIFLQVHGKSKEASKLLFIENLETFTSCMNSNNPIFDEYVLINAHGYKSSALRIRKVNGSKLFFSFSCNLNERTKKSFISWFYSDNNSKEVYFWGDLDKEGISILKAHQKSFPSLKAWEIAYESMIEEVLNNNAHNEKEGCKKNHKLVEETLCTYTNEVLIPFLKEKDLYFDQEGLNVDLLKR